MAGVKGKSGGARPGAGGKPKPPALLSVKAVPNGDPLAFLVAVMNDTTATCRLRLEAAKTLMPFIHAKKTEGGKKDTAQNAAKTAGAGRFKPSAPPLKLVQE